MFVHVKVDCRSTPNGCCKDGETIASGPEFFGCSTSVDRTGKCKCSDSLHIAEKLLSV